LDDIPLKQKIRDFVHKIGKYAPIFYITVLFSLLTFQLDIFKESFPKDYIIDVIIAISIFMFGSIALDKIISRNVNDPKPYLYCPECEDAKMRATGKWVCEKCHQEFGEPKKE